MLHGGISIVAATRGPDLHPELTRAAGVRVARGGARLTVYLPEATSAATLANLADNGQVALTCAVVATNIAAQIKGRAAVVRPGRDDERAVVERYRELLTEALRVVGMPPAIAGRLTVWPCLAVEVDIAEVFEQTPGPGAGARMAP